MPSCKNCQNPFSIHEEDASFYKKMDVPEPTHCPQCRQKRRLAFRNEMNLYQRKCDLTGKTVISMYSADKPYKIYDQGEWWSDKWDAIEYGRNVNFNRPFFEQFAELQKAVPRMSLNCIGNENSEYTNYSLRNKNSYLVFTADYNEDSYYLRFADKNFNTIDCDFSWDCTECYDSIHMKNCNRCMFSQKCDGSSGLYFCYDMRNCHDCIGCANLRNKNYHVFNKPVSKSEFQKISKELNVGSRKGLQESLKKMETYIQSQPHKFLEIVHCEDCYGDYLHDSKNAKSCFDCHNLQDVKHASHLYESKDCYDWDFVGYQSELCYEMVSCAYRLINCRFTMNSWDGNNNLTYCDLCLGNNNLFGCVGMRKKEYCILNKQYSKEEYEKLVQKIIEHMQKTEEWGEFFPLNLSPFGYNETLAQEYYPLKKEDAQQKGYNWQEKDLKEYKSQSYQVPDNIQDVQDDIIKAALSCTECEKNFLITAQELKCYKEWDIPIPEKCYQCRHKNRTKKRNPRHLVQKSCTKCGQNIFTTYQKDNSIPVYCEKCYTEEIY